MSVLFRIDEPATGAVNMQRDMELRDNVERGLIDIGIRLYTWNPHCVSLGKHQRIESINQNTVHELGYDIVYRPTGGRAVLHADEVTYCVCIRLSDSTRAQPVYAGIHTWLYHVLIELAPELQNASIATDLRTHYSSQQELGQACFSSHAKSELLWGTKKIVGSAQRVIDGVLLQHGSILCGNGHEKLASIIARDPSHIDHLRSAIAESSATLSECAQRTVTTSELLERFHTHAQTQQYSADVARIISLARGEQR